MKQPPQDVINTHFAAAYAKAQAETGQALLICVIRENPGGYSISQFGCGTPTQLAVAAASVLRQSDTIPMALIQIIDQILSVDEPLTAKAH